MRLFSFLAKERGCFYRQKREKVRIPLWKKFENHNGTIAPNSRQIGEKLGNTKTRFAGKNAAKRVRVMFISYFYLLE